MAIVKGGYDLLFDKIVLALETYSATQVLADRFKVFPDYYRNYPASAGAASVFVYMGQITPTEQSVEGYYQYDVSYNIDMVSLASGSLSASAYERASEATGARLRALIQQCLNALFVPGTFNFSLGDGQLSKKPMPPITPIYPEGQMGERPMAGARMVFTAGMCFEPGAITGTAIDSYLITNTDAWSILLEP
jgi:hypothetical protein